MLGIPYEGRIPPFAADNDAQPPSASVLAQRQLRQEQDDAFQQSLQVGAQECLACVVPVVPKAMRALCMPNTRAYGPDFLSLNCVSIRQRVLKLNKLSSSRTTRMCMSENSIRQPPAAGKSHWQ